jgi:DnaJ-class molecular chaperone
MKDNFYEILGVSKDASENDIKKAYRKLSLQYHPDRNQESESEEKIRKINVAYETLRDKEKRRQYDMGDTQIFPGFAFQQGFPFPFHQGFQFQQGSPQVFTFNQSVSTGDSDIHNILKMMFNEGNFSNHNIHIFQNGMFPPNMP